MGISRTSREDSRAYVQLLHDLRQYVAAGILLTQPSDTRHEPVDGRLERVYQVFQRMSELTAPPPSVTTSARVTDLVELVDECVAVTRLNRDVPLDVDGDLPIEAACDPVLLRRAVSNVLDNATRAAGDTGKVQVRVHRLPGEAIVEVRDDGHGFGRIPSLSGQGMSIVDQALRTCHGRLEIISGPGPGTTVRMIIPEHVVRDVRRDGRIEGQQEVS